MVAALPLARRLEGAPMTTDGYYLKWVRKGRVPSYQAGAPIPYRRWTDTVADPLLCKRGWHGCRWEDTIVHISDELWVCELGGQVVAGDDKVVSERLRLVRKTPMDDRRLRLFAADCAEDVLPLFEQERPDDVRPRAAIAAARAFARGEITAAARDAARAAARAAAGDAAGAAARAAAGAAARAAARAHLTPSVDQLQDSAIDLLDALIRGES
jgi:hypothetical protein